MAKVELEQDRSTETDVLMEEDGANEEVTAAQGQPFSKNGSPLRPPLNQPEEDGSEEENDEDSSPIDPLYSHAQEDLGPPIGAAPKRKGKKRASSPRLPVERSVLPPPDGFTLSNEKFFEYRTQFSRPVDLNWSGSLSVTTTTLGPMAGMSAH